MRLAFLWKIYPYASVQMKTEINSTPVMLFRTGDARISASYMRCSGHLNGGIHTTFSEGTCPVYKSFCSESPCRDSNVSPVTAETSLGIGVAAPIGSYR